MEQYVKSVYSNALWGDVVFVTRNSQDDPYSIRVRTNWLPDPEVFLAIELLEKSEGDVLDLGANIGTWCIPVCLASKRKVFALEALPANVELMQMSVELNNLQDDISVYEVAIWDEDTILKFSGSSAYGVVDERGNVSVSAMSLDSLYRKGLISSVSLIKMDIEGCELRAIKGAGDLLNDFKPDLIFEGNGAHCIANGYLPQDMIKILELYGYNIYMIVNNILVKSSSTSFQPFGLINYLATTKDCNSLKRFKISELSDEICIAKVRVAFEKMKPGYGKFMLEQLNSQQLQIAVSVKKIIESYVKK